VVVHDAVDGRHYCSWDYKYRHFTVNINCVWNIQTVSYLGVDEITGDVFAFVID